MTFTSTHLRLMLVALVLCAVAVIPPPTLLAADRQPEARQPEARRAAAAKPAERPVTSTLTARATRRVIRMEVTAYCPCTKCCGPNAQGITASGRRVSHNNGRFVAADTRVLPFGKRLSIPGYHNGTPVEVLDTGSAIKGTKLDVYFPSHQTALEWGRRTLDVTVVE